MKVLDLQCRQGHVFEGWFASEDDFQGQKQRGLVQCPLCGDDHIEKRLSAPRLNLGARAPAAADTTVPAHPTATAGAQVTASSEAAMLPPALQAAWLARLSTRSYLKAMSRYAGMPISLASVTGYLSCASPAGPPASSASST